MYIIQLPGKKIYFKTYLQLIQSTIIFNHTNFLLLRYIQGGDNECILTIKNWCA